MGISEKSAFARDALTLGKGLLQFVELHVAEDGTPESRLLRAARILGTEMLGYVASDIDSHLAALVERTERDTDALCERCQHPLVAGESHVCSQYL